jgi:autotransporter passenger strand-loop-strand repeat protein
MTTVSSGQTLIVSSGQTSTGVIVLSGGTLEVLSGGSVVGTVDSGGNDFISAGGQRRDGVRRRRHRQ